MNNLQSSGVAHPEFLPQEEEAVLWLTSIDQDHKEKPISLGSGFIIAPYLALTAKHVVQGFVEEYYGKQGELPGHALLEPGKSRFRLYAFHRVIGSDAPRKYVVDLVSLSDFSDIAVLRLQPLFSDEFKWRCLVLQARPNVIGWNTRGVGYVVEHTHERDMVVGSVEDAYWTSGTIHRSDGIIRAVHEISRDNNLYFPCFQTNAIYHGGMSGGPVFPAFGPVCGIVVSCLPKSSYDLPEAEHFSHAAILYPLLGSMIEYTLPGRSTPTLCTMSQLISLGLVRLRNTEGFSVRYGTSGLPEMVEFRRPDRS